MGIYRTKKVDVYLLLTLIIFFIAIIPISGKVFLDEITLILILLYYNYKKNSVYIFINKIRTYKIEFAYLFYVFLNCFFSFIQNINFSPNRGQNFYTVRYLVITLLCFLLLVFFDEKFNDATRIKHYLAKYIIVLSWLLIVYWIICTIFKISWVDSQGLFLPQITYLSYSISIGHFLYWLVTPQSKKLSLSSPYLQNLIQILILSYMYSSRLLFCVFLTSILFLIFIIKIKIRIFILLGTLLLIFSQNIFTIGVSSNYKPTEIKSYNFLSTDKFLNFYESIIFLFNPRVSDKDREGSIECAFSIINSSSLTDQIFGLGSGSHRSSFYLCSGKDVTDPGNAARPVFVAAYIVDFGYTGLFLGLVLLIRRFVLGLRYKVTLMSHLILFFSFLVLFLVNIYDSALFWIIVFTKLIIRIDKE